MKARNHDLDTKLMIHRARKVVLGAIVLVATVVFSFLIRQGLVSDSHWLVYGLPLLVMGLAFILYPRTEYWLYEPWQSKPRRIEQTSER